MITLTKEERELFAAWLEQEATIEEGLVQQMESLGAIDLVIRQYRAEYVAKRIVIKDLRVTDDVAL